MITPREMRLAVILLMLIGYVMPLAASTADSLLLQLDGMLPGRGIYEQDRRMAIDKAKADYRQATTEADKYAVLRTLYRCYRSYRVDSALIVADERLAIANSLGDPSKIVSATINLAESYAKSGDYDKAIGLLDSIDDTALEDYHIKYRNSVYRTAYSMKHRSAILERERMEALEKLRYYRSQSLNFSQPTAGNRDIMQAEQLLDAGMSAEAVAKVDQARHDNDYSDNPQMLYTMGEIYLAGGRNDDAKECLARSAILDVASGTKEYASLILLASVLHDEGDVKRAFEYINCAFEDAIFSRANFRTAEVMKFKPVIDAAFMLAESRANERNRRYLMLTAVTAVLLLVSVVMLVRSLRRNRAMLATIADVNRQLEDQNQELVKADAVKLKNINILMMAYARYISRLREFRKSISRLMNGGQYQKTIDFVKSDKPEARELSDFHAMFDEAFLSMFPDFVDKINGYFKVPYVLKVPGRLTPELRVIAMMRLGITSTDEIAGMLHYTPQTVYNHRSAIRSMLAVSKEEFEAAVRDL